MKKLLSKAIIMFIIYFCCFFLFNSIWEYKNWSFTAVLNETLFFSLWLTGGFLLYDLFFVHPRIPYYFNLKKEKEILEILDSIGVDKTFVTKEKMKYKIIGATWPNNRIIIKKTPFYILVEFPEKYVEYFDKMDTLNQKLH